MPGMPSTTLPSPATRSRSSPFSSTFWDFRRPLLNPTLNPTWWYLSLAMLLIFATPFVMSAVRKFGSLPVLVVGVLGIAMFEVGTDAVFMYAASYLMGIFCHENGVLDGWKGGLSDRRGGHALKALLALGPFLLLLTYRNSFDHYGVIDALLATLMCMLVMTCLRRVPLVSTALGLLGRHSSNIFFTHTLLYSYYFLGFYYSLRYPVVVLTALGVTTLALSVVLEKAKETSGYNAFMSRLGKRALERVSD